MQVVVLEGGRSNERLESTKAASDIVEGLKLLNHSVFTLDVSESFVEDAIRLNVDVAFNALLGAWGEDGRIQAVLDWLKIPYTHSGVLPSALAMNKYACGIFLAGLNHPFISGHCVSKNNVDKFIDSVYPLFVKPVADGSSIGVSLCNNFNDLQYRIQFDESILVQEYLSGREFSVTILNYKYFGISEIIYDGKFYSNSDKAGTGSVRKITPPDIPISFRDYLIEESEAVFRNLMCRGVARVDWRCRSGISDPAILEVNTQPILSNGSIIRVQADYLGISFLDILNELLMDASTDK